MLPNETPETPVLVYMTKKNVLQFLQFQNSYFKILKFLNSALQRQRDTNYSECVAKTQIFCSYSFQKLQPAVHSIW